METGQSQVWRWRQEIAWTNPTFKRRFFEKTGWALSDLCRIWELAEGHQQEGHLAESSSFTSAWGTKPSQSEKQVRKGLGKPALSLHDHFWNPNFSLLVYPRTIGSLRLKMQLLFHKSVLACAVIEPASQFLSDAQVFSILRNFCGEQRFFQEPPVSAQAGNALVRTDCDGTTMVMETLFNLRIYLLRQDHFTHTLRMSA